jgi:DNA-3-methyladenine glycosylase II
MSAAPPVQAQSVDLPFAGSFDLAQSIDFGFGQRPAGGDDVMRLAFCLDGLSQQVGVAVRQVGQQRLALEIVGDADVDCDAVRAHVARVLSVDIDGTDYDALGQRDPLVGRVQRARPGLRPPLFYSAYEAAAWSVLSARQPFAQMAAARERLSRSAGRVFEVAGQEVAALPLPAALAEVTEVPGLRSGKVERLHAVAAAAAAGELDMSRLRALDPDEARSDLQRLPGIGPFYAELIVVRALGHTDVLATNEPKVRELAAQLTGVAELSPGELEQLAEGWRPWRTWVQVAIRAGAARS